MEWGEALMQFLFAFPYVRDVDHLFGYLLAICNSPFVKFLFSSFAHFFIESLILWKFSFWSTWKFWLLVPSQLCSWQRCSPMLWAVSSAWWPFPLLCKRFLVSCSPNSWSFLFIAILLESSILDIIAYGCMF
jgi:hypothetical protein